MPRPAPWTEGQAKVSKTWDQTGGISARIGRIVKEIATNFGKTTETCAPTVRICDKTKVSFVMTGNNCSMMDVLGRAPDNSNRTGNRCGTTVRMSRAIVGMYGVIAKTIEATYRISEATDRTDIRIGMT
jgi:hypothetical protein